MDKNLLNYYNGAFAEIARKKDEQELLKEFLFDHSFEGKLRILEIQQEARQQATFQFEGKTDFLRDLVVEKLIRKMRDEKSSSGISLYQDRILKIAETFSNRKEKAYFRRLRNNGNSKGMPLIVEKLKQGEEVLIDEIKKNVGDDECIDYLSKKEGKHKISVIAKDLFYAINNGLDRGGARKFMSVMYELRKLKTSILTNQEPIKLSLLRAIEGEAIEVIHLKCPRYAYPKGEKLTVLDKIADENIPTKDGTIFKHIGDDYLFDQLIYFYKIFSGYRIPVVMTILLMDQDLEDHILPDQELLIAKQSLEKFKEAIEERLIDTTISTCYLRSFLEESGSIKEFDDKRKKVLSELNRGISKLPERFVESRVDYRTEMNGLLYKTNPGRQYARDRAYTQIATLQAIGVLITDKDGYKKNLFLVEEDRGEENNYIGGIRPNILPVFFMKLRENPDKMENKKYGEAKS